MRASTSLLTAILLSTALAGCTEDNGTTTSPTPSASTCQGITHASLTVSNHSHTVVLLDTAKGCIVAELYDDKTPLTVANFKKLVQADFYKDMLFHRIIKDFMIQTGGMQTNGEFKESPFGPVKNEAKSSGLKNLEYTLSMARTTSPDSATNQFFINTANNANLDPSAQSAGYTVFGIVVRGKEVVDSIESTPVTMYNAPGANTHCQGDSSPSCPKEDQVLRSIKLLG